VRNTEDDNDVLGSFTIDFVKLVASLEELAYIYVKWLSVFCVLQPSEAGTQEQSQVTGATWD
jgi:hypothetical protein